MDRIVGWRSAAGGWHMGIMNFGTIPDSHLTIDLAESVGLAAYLLPLAAMAGLALGVAVLWAICSRIAWGGRRK